MSNFRPCLAGTQPARKRFEALLSQVPGISVTLEQLNSVKEDFEKVCQTARKPMKDQVLAVDYFILAAHTDFHVPTNSAGSDVQELKNYPFFFSRITAPLFFSTILSAASGPRATVTDDSSAIVAFAGGDPSYAKRAIQILQPWTDFSQAGAAGKVSNPTPR